ncbi:MAG: endonuclease/exonuclease/phosphatase family protein [Aeromonas sp.]
MSPTLKSLLCAALAASTLTGCTPEDAEPTMIRFATFNVSFDRSEKNTELNGGLTAELDKSRAAQEDILKDAEWSGADSNLVQRAKAIRQIRNVAEIIQRTRPDVLLLNEVNNRGSGDAQDLRDLQLFNDNYLKHAQHDDVEAIDYAHRRSFATNTGLGRTDGRDLNNNGKKNEPEDAWGYGSFHGQYAFAVLSQHPFGSGMRSFQDFKWQDMPTPYGKNVGEWGRDIWNAFPLSSKNHVDLPINIQRSGQDETIHFLISHPTPPIGASYNVQRNAAEVAFWHFYINDELGSALSGLDNEDKFVIAGDLNADPYDGDGDIEAIQALLDDARINPEVSNGALLPTSSGGDRDTSISNLRLDYVLPSANLTATASGVFWPSESEDGYHLVNDPELGEDKGVSSDHRLVWVDVQIGGEE